MRREILLKVLRRLRRAYRKTRNKLTALRYSIDRNALRMTVQTLKDLPERPPAGSKRLVLFAHYDAQDEVDEYVRFYLEKLNELGSAIIFVSGSPNLKEEAAARIASLCAGIYTCKSLSLDFGSWNLAWQQMRKKGWNLGEFDQCVFANDSVYGPLFDLSEMFSQFVGADMYGVTESLEYAPHLQSYFLVWDVHPATQRFIEKFWRDFRYLDDKDQLIEHYELGISARAREFGLHQKAYISNSAARAAAEKYQDHEHREKIRGRDVNNTLYLWDTLISHLRCPFLKTEVPRSNRYRSVKIHDLPRFLETWTDYDHQLISRHLERLGSTQRFQLTRPSDEMAPGPAD
jgi:lipopolysaccharide biosynthesis protein